MLHNTIIYAILIFIATMLVFVNRNLAVLIKDQIRVGNNLSKLLAALHKDLIDLEKRITRRLK